MREKRPVLFTIILGAAATLLACTPTRSPEAPPGSTTEVAAPSDSPPAEADPSQPAVEADPSQPAIEAGGDECLADRYPAVVTRAIETFLAEYSKLWGLFDGVASKASRLDALARAEALPYWQTSPVIEEVRRIVSADQFDEFIPEDSVANAKALLAKIATPEKARSLHPADVISTVQALHGIAGRHLDLLYSWFAVNGDHPDVTATAYGLVTPERRPSQAELDSPCPRPRDLDSYKQ